MKRQTVGVLLAFGVIAAAAAALVAARTSRHRSLTAALPEIKLDRFPAAAHPLIADLTAQVRKEPLRADRWGELGYALAGNEALPEAAACFARAEEIEPDNFRWPHLFADALLRTDRRVEAVAALKRAVNLMPNSATTVGLLAEAY